MLLTECQADEQWGEIPPMQGFDDHVRDQTTLWEHQEKRSQIHKV